MQFAIRLLKQHHKQPQKSYFNILKEVFNLLKQYYCRLTIIIQWTPRFSDSAAMTADHNTQTNVKENIYAREGEEDDDDGE